jgi:hypothetical protein
MRTSSPYVLVKIDFERHNTHTFSNGQSIQVEKQYREDFNKRYSNPDSGWVFATPRTKEVNGSPMILEEGDYVFFHFHTFSEWNEVWVDGQVYYKVNYSNIYFKYDLDSHEIVPVNQFLLTEILKKDVNIRFPNGTIIFNGGTIELQNKSRVAYKPPYIDTVDVGQVVYHKPNTHYDIELPDGRRLYRIRDKEIIAIEN